MSRAIWWEMNSNETDKNALRTCKDCDFAGYNFPLTYNVVGFDIYEALEPVIFILFWIYSYNKQNTKSGKRAWRRSGFRLHTIVQGE